MLMMYLSLVETAEDKNLFQQIYYTYRKQMYFVAISILENENLAEDAVQDAFFGVARQIALLREMPEQKKRAYVLTAAKNAAINIYNDEKKHRPHPLDFDEVKEDYWMDETMNTQISKETCQTVLAVIAELSPLQRDILTLRCSYGLNCQQIAVALGRKPSTVRKELSRARRTLRERCKWEGIEIAD